MEFGVSRLVRSAGRRAATAKPSKQLTSREQRNIIVNAPTERVPLAQLDRASGYGPEGRGFESLMVRQRHRQSRCLFSSPRDSEPVADARLPRQNFFWRGPRIFRLHVFACRTGAKNSLFRRSAPYESLMVRQRHRRSRCLFSSPRDSEPVADAVCAEKNDTVRTSER